MMRKTGLMLTLISIGIVFIDYHLAIFTLAIALLFFGSYHLYSNNKGMGYVYLIAGFFFIVGIILIDFNN